jgi:hypothetical protein
VSIRVHPWLNRFFEDEKEDEDDSTIKHLKGQPVLSQVLEGCDGLKLPVSAIDGMAGFGESAHNQINSWAML